MRTVCCNKMAELASDDVEIGANEDDLDRILSHSNAIIGNLDKFDGEASAQCNGTSTVNLTDINCSGGRTSSFGVNNVRVTPGVSNTAVISDSTAGTTAACVPCVTAIRTNCGPMIVRAGSPAGQLVPTQSSVHPTQGGTPARRLMQPNMLMPPFCGPSTPVVDGRLPNTARSSNLVTMLMRPSASNQGTVTPLLHPGAVRSPGGPAVPVSSAQVVDTTCGDQGTARHLVVSNNVMPTGIRFIQSVQQPQQQPRLQHLQVIAFKTGLTEVTTDRN